VSVVFEREEGRGTPAGETMMRSGDVEVGKGVGDFDEPSVK
jgi:hypothetical protein